MVASVLFEAYVTRYSLNTCALVRALVFCVREKKERERIRKVIKIVRALDELSKKSGFRTR